MNTTSDTAGRSRRLLLAAGLVAAPALMALGIGFEPAVPTHRVATFQVIAGQSGRYYLAVLATIAGLGLLPVVGAAIAALVQRRGRAAATWAAALFGIGGIAGGACRGPEVPPPAIPGTLSDLLAVVSRGLMKARWCGWTWTSSLGTGPCSKTNGS